MGWQMVTYQEGDHWLSLQVEPMKRGPCSIYVPGEEAWAADAPAPTSTGVAGAASLPRRRSSRSNVSPLVGIPSFVDRRATTSRCPAHDSGTTWLAMHYV